MQSLSRRFFEAPSHTPEFGIILIGGSLGSFQPVKSFLSHLPPDFPIPVVVALHRSWVSPDVVPLIMRRHCSLAVSGAIDGEMPRPGVAYFNPPGTHVSFGRAGQFRVAVGPRIRHYRPSIDLLFRSAADRFGHRTLAMVMSGRLNDGAAGAARIVAAGGVVIAQSPRSAQIASMPRAVVENGTARYVLETEVLARAAISLVMVPGARALFGAQPLAPTVSPRNANASQR